LREGKNIKNTILFILDFAKDNNLPIFCIDSSKIQTNEYNKASLYGRWFLKSESRDEDMFGKIVENHGEGENIVIFCGANHLSENLHFRTGKETLGSRLKNKFGDNYEKII